MRIALYCDNNSRAGVYTYTIGLAGALQNLGQQVRIITHSAVNHARGELIAEMRTAADVTEIPWTGNARSDVRNISAVLHDFAPNIYLPNYRHEPYAAAIQHCGSMKTVGFLHSADASYWNLLKRYASIICHFVSATPDSAQEMSRMLNTQNVTCIPHGVSVCGRSNPFEGGEIRIIYHGRLREEQKRVAKILDVADHLLKARIPFSMDLIGDGPDKGTYFDRVQNGPLAKFVTIHDSMDWNGLVPYIQRAHLAILTSEHEGFCFSLAEAMAAGLPAVAYRVEGVIEDYLQDGINGFLVDQDDSRGMADRIARLQADSALWSRMSEAAAAAIRSRFSWAQTGAKYLQLFERLSASDFSPAWPRLRPQLPPSVRSLRSVVERIGRLTRYW